MSTTLFTSLQALAHSFVWALMHSFWQAGAVYLLLILLFKLFPSGKARTRYASAYIGLGAIVYWFADTWLSYYQKLAGYTVVISQQVAGELRESSQAIHIYAPAQDFGLYQLQVYVTQHCDIIIALYCTGLLLMMGRLLFGLVQMRRLRTKDIVAADEQWVEFVANAAERMGIGRRVQLFLSTQVVSPLMLGVVKPVILLPVATMNQLSVHEVETILLHELAHIRRHDYLLNLLQVVVEVVLFFNPFVWLLSSIIRREREYCCDDMVVAHSADPMTYAKALANLQITGGSLALAQAASGNKNQLLIRIKRIMEMKTTQRNYGRTAIAIILLIAAVVTVMVSGLTPSFAQKANKTEGSADSSGKKRIVSKTVVVDNNGKRTEHATTAVTHSGSKSTEGHDVDVHVSFSDGTHRPHSLIDSGDVDRVVSDIRIASKDFSSAMAEVGDQLAAVDWDEVRAEIRNALKEVDHELAHNLKDVNIEVRKELEKSKAELERSKAELERTRNSRSALRENDGFEPMLREMERDGLIDRDKKYKIEKEDNELYINGKLQSTAVYQKYAGYLQHEHISIKGSRGTLATSISD